MNRKGLVYENIGCGMMFIFMLLSAVFAFGGIIQAALTLKSAIFLLGYLAVPAEKKSTILMEYQI